MKKWLIALLVLLCVAVPALADVPDKPDTFAYAYDLDADVLSASDIAQITRYGEALEDATGAQVIAVAVDFLDGMTPEDYATDLINEWGIGQKDEDNGVVVLLSRGDRRIQIGTGKGIDRTLSGSKAGALIDQNIDYFADNRFAEGMVALYQDVCTYIAKAQGKTLSFSSSSASSTGIVSGYDDRDESDTLDFFIGLVFMYVVFCVIINTVFKGKSCCLKMLFLGWLLDNKKKPPRGGGFGGGFGSGPGRSMHMPRAPRSFGGGFSGGSSRSSRSFGGGSSRGSSSSRSFGGGSRSSGRSFGGGGSRGGGGGRSF